MAFNLVLARQALRNASNLFSGPDTLQGSSTTGTETLDNDGGAGGNPLVVVAQTNPYGFVNVAEMAGDAAVADPTLVFTRQLVGTFPASGTWTVFSVFVKRPTTGTPMTGFTLNIKVENHGLQDHRVGFKWVGTTLQRDTTLDTLFTTDQFAKVGFEEWANGWYRCFFSYMVSTAGGDTTIAGDSRRLYIRGMDADLSNKNLWLWGMQCEELPDFNPTDYFTGCGIRHVRQYPSGYWEASIGRCQISVVPGQNLQVKLFARTSPNHPWVQVLSKTQADLDAVTGTAIFACEVEAQMLLQFPIDIPVGALPCINLCAG